MPSRSFVSTLRLRGFLHINLQTSVLKIPEEDLRLWHNHDIFGACVETRYCLVWHFCGALPFPVSPAQWELRQEVLIPQFDLGFLAEVMPWISAFLLSNVASGFITNPIVAEICLLRNFLNLFSSISSSQPRVKNWEKVAVRASLHPCRRSQPCFNWGMGQDTPRGATDWNVDGRFLKWGHPQVTKTFQD